MRDWSLYEEYVQKLMDEHHIVGAAVAVSEGDKVVFEKGFGVKDIETKEPVTPDTIFGVASVSKSFTALAMTMLADAGKISLDDPVVKYLPEFKLSGVEDMECVKIHHILSHTTGLPPMTRREDIKTFDEHLKFLAQEDYEVLGAPKDYFSYSNDTFLLNGAIIERVTGELYRRFMTREVLDSLKMYRTTYNLGELEPLGDVSTPYIYDEEEKSHKEVPWPTLGTYEVGGGVRSNVRDLMKYGSLYVNDGLVKGRRLVSQEGLSRMRASMYQTGRKTYYALALTVSPNYGDDGVTLVQHGGSQPGVSSNFGFVPEKDLSVAVLTNVTGVPAGLIWLGAVNFALGYPLDQKISVEPHYDATPEELKRLVGTYRCNEGGWLKVEYKDGGLVGTSDYINTALRPSGPDTVAFILSGTEYVAKFYMDEKGLPWAAFLSSRMLRKVE